MGTKTQAKHMAGVGLDLSQGLLIGALKGLNLQLQTLRARVQAAFEGQHDVRKLHRETGGRVRVCHLYWGNH